MVVNFLCDLHSRMSAASEARRIISAAKREAALIASEARAEAKRLLRGLRTSSPSSPEYFDTKEEAAYAKVVKAAKAKRETPPSFMKFLETWHSSSEKKRGGARKTLSKRRRSRKA